MLGYFRLGWKYIRQDFFRYWFYSSHYIHGRRMSSIDMIYCTADTKATPASASIFILVWILLVQNVVKRVH